MKKHKITFLAPILLIALGAGWLLMVLEVAPMIDWILTCGLVAMALLTFVLGGFNKVTIVIGPLFVLATIVAVLRQTDQVPQEFEIPVFVLALGVLLLLANSRSIPAPDWLIDDMKRGGNSNDEKSG